MKHIFLTILLFLSLPAYAEVSVWTDPDFGFRITYPDGWTKQVAPHNDLRLHIVSPAFRDRAQCKISIEQDDRFKIFPGKYLADIVKRELGDTFWRQHLVNQNGVQFNYLSEGGKLGDGYATYIDYSFIESFNSRPSVPMRGLAYATIFQDMRTVVDCSAHAQSFSRRYPQFTSMMKSVRFDKGFSETPYGAYRNFFRDYPILIQDGSRTRGF